MKLEYLLSLIGGFILTRLLPFLFGTRIYDEHWWRIMAPSAVLLGPGSGASALDKTLSTGIDSLIFGLIIFAAVQALRYAVSRLRVTGH